MRKTPESFLGENSSLVNLENLIPATRPKSTNPFGSTAVNPTGMASSTSMSTGLSTSSSSGHLSNPFLASAGINSQPVVPKPNYNVSLGPTQPPAHTPLMFPTMYPSGPYQTNTTSFPILPNQAPFASMMAPASAGPTGAFGQLNTQTAQSGANSTGTSSSTNPFLMM